MSYHEDTLFLFEGCFASCEMLSISFVTCLLVLGEVIIIFDFVQIVHNNRDTIKYYANCFNQEKY